MFRKILFFILLIQTVTFAQLSQRQALEMVKQNPALLNTPMAREALRKYKKDTNDKQQIASQKIINNIEDINTTNDEKVKDLNNTKEKVQEQIIQKVEKNDNRLYTNPLLYKENIELLKDIKSKQNKIKVTQKLARFNKTFFKNKNKFSATSMSVPDYYIINKGDSISIWLYGSVNKNIESTIDTQGFLNIDTLGPIKIAGLSFKEASTILKKQLSKAFSNANVSINISSASTIQVTLTGDVKGPGVYNLAALSTVKDLLIYSGGVKERGSVRNILIKRDNKILATIDFYELLFGKDSTVSSILRNGDIIFVPRATKLVSIKGAVDNNAIFELTQNETLKDLIYYAGGLGTNASKHGIQIHSIDSNERNVISSIDYKRSSHKKLNDGDQIYIYGIDSIKESSTYFYGNVVRPGGRELQADKSLQKLLLSEIEKLGLNGVFLQNTLFNYALIKRQDENLTTKILRFNPNEIINKSKDIFLQEEDEVYFFSTLDTKVNPFVTIQGDVVNSPGEFQYFNGLSVFDLIQIAGIKSPFDKNKIKITTFNTPDLMPKIHTITYKEAAEYQLSPLDVVELFDYYDVNEISTVTIKGEVYLPNGYSLNKNMSVKDLINIAGGLTKKAYLKNCEIVRFNVINNERVKNIINLDLTKDQDFILQNHDEITIFTIPNWSERKAITLTGEVKFPGEYIIEHGDTLYNVIKRAGGFTRDAYLYGAIFTRESIKKLQQKALQDALIKLKQRMAILSSQPKEAGMGNTDLMQTVKMIDTISKEAQALQPIGRIAISIDNNLENFKNSTSNLTLKDKDTLHIPAYNDTILVMGEVMNQTAIIFDSNNAVSEYIKSAGGYTQLADEDNVYIVQANGIAQKYDTSIFGAPIELKKGAVIYVPQEIITTSGMQFAKDISSILYQFAVTAAALNTVGAL